jgi:hypothetical protein
VSLTITKLVFAAVVGLGFALASSAQAVQVPVLNPSFEFNNFGTVNGIPNVMRGVDWWEIRQDGTQDGNGFVNGNSANGTLGGQPTSNHNPKDWVTTENAGDAVAWDARWPGWDNATNAAPSHGLQSLLFDNRGPGRFGQVKQSLGTVQDLRNLGVGAVDSLVMTFDARLGGFNNGNGGENENVELFAFFEVNNTKSAAGQFHSHLGSIANGRLIPTWTELGGTGVDTTVMANPVPVVANGFASQADHMGHFSATLDLSGLATSDEISIVLRYEDNRASGGCCGTRTYVDNVGVASSNVIPEPSTLALAALGLLGLMGIRRRNR